MGWQVIIILGMLFSAVFWVYDKGYKSAEANTIAKGAKVSMKSYDEVLEINTTLAADHAERGKALTEAQAALRANAPAPEGQCPANCDLKWPGVSFRD